ncbi:hypothetical protein BKA70DRAFT_1429171 [Coprinopsis sp. MPI-PUGE-AT-0042]|nr:hypothetical protein BKA70DRAFT_1429171 [Coprinopsis sp. MPI-PUGE-AT-0042]
MLQPSEIPRRSMFEWTVSMGNTTRRLYNGVSALLSKPTTAATADHSPLSTMEDLPQELLLKILEFIGDDRTTVRNLSLVASTFTSACQKHLFTTVTIRPPILPSVGAPPRNAVPRAEALSCISAHTTLRTYVQAIAIQDEYTGTFKSWLKDPELGLAMKQLSEATTITNFTFSRHVADPALDYAISDDLMSAITNFCRSPTLRSISLLNNAPLCLLDLCGPSLQHLTLEDEKDFSKPTQSFDRIAPLPLASLRLGRRTPLATISDWCLDQDKVVQLGDLQRLSVNLARLDESPQLSRLLPRCPAIEELDIEAGPYILPRSTEVSVNLSAQTKLQRLRIQGHLYKSSYKQLSWVVSTLATLPPASSLTEIKLDVDVKRNREQFTHPSWAELDQLVADEDLFPNLTRFSLDIRNYADRSLYGESRASVIEAVIKQLQESLPLLAGRNLGTVRLRESSSLASEAVTSES